MANSREVIIKYESYPNTDSLKRPTIKIKFNPQDKQSFSCLVDSGADCSIFPLSIGEKLEIDFSESDPLERPPQQMSGKMECKCYPKSTSIYGPWEKNQFHLRFYGQTPTKLIRFWEEGDFLTNSGKSRFPNKKKR